MHARSHNEPELLQAHRRKREPREIDRPTPARRPRRRRQSIPWLQRNALSVAAISILIAFLGLGFGLVQMLNRPDGTASPLALAQGELAVATPGTTLLPASTVGSSQPLGSLAGPEEAAAAAASQRSIHANAKVLEPNYTIAPGDTLVKIAQRFNTTVERIQAFNSLSDPRALRIGAKLVIPPPL
jgi:nucleoid-associated protein YgaU